MESLLITLRGVLGDGLFIPLMLAVAAVLSLKVIPLTTDMMVNAAAGLADKHLGSQYRTLVINCSTNNPEIATMIVALLFSDAAMRIGGIGTPLGSNFANIYLIFLVALGWVLIRMRWSDPASFRGLLALLKKERRLVIWHFLMSFGMFLLACVAFRLLTGQFPIPMRPPSDVPVASGRPQIALAGIICLIGVGIFLWRDAALRRQRAELMDDIDDADHTADWKLFGLGTAGLVLGCYAINAMFEASTALYSVQLAEFLGPAVFAVLHYFLGALVTSLPEMTVAINNYRRILSPDLNTALSSASTSNMSNLSIAACGCLIAMFL